MALCLLLAGCGAAGEGEPAGDADALRQTYREMAGCAMTAEVTCGGAEDVTVFTVRCQYDPAGESTVEVTAPDTVAGIRAGVPHFYEKSASVAELNGDITFGSDFKK